MDDHNAFRGMPESITTQIIGILSPQDTIALSQTDRLFRHWTEDKRKATREIVAEIADFNRGNQFGLTHMFSRGGTLVELVKRWLTSGMTNWVGTLNTDGATEIAEAIIRKKCPKLTSIDINIYYHQPHFNKVLGILLSRGGGDNITTINIGTNYEEGARGSTSDDDIRLVAQHCPSLISVTVEGSFLHSESIIQLATKCTQLEHVDLVGTSAFKSYMGPSNIDDAGIIALAKHCKNLKYLDVGGLKLLTDKSLVALGKFSKHLGWIRLYRWHNKKQETRVFYYPTLYGQPGLKALMEGCKNIEISYKVADVPENAVLLTDSEDDDSDLSPAHSKW